MTAQEIIQKYIQFFKDRGHVQIANASLVPENDPTTLFTSSGMQPLITYLLGQIHPAGKRLVNVQNSFRAQDIEEVGDNRHTTFFRMIGNWSLGDYFKKEQLPWFFEFLTQELKLSPKKLYVTVFEGNNDVPKDEESVEIWKKIFSDVGLNPEERISYYGVEKNWWSRSGTPDKMPVGEPGGPDSEVFYDFGVELQIHENSPYKNQGCHPNCDCGRFLEIGNSVFMQYKKIDDKTFEELPNRNVDFGGGLERLVAATENTPDIFQASLFTPIIEALEKETEFEYTEKPKDMRIIVDHFVAASFMTASSVKPGNKEQGYILRRLIRRGLDHLYALKETKIEPILEAIVAQYATTDLYLTEKFEEIKNVLLEEEQKYEKTRKEAKKYIEKEVAKIGQKTGDELLGYIKISSDLAFKSLASYGLGPTQLESLGYRFDHQALAEKIKEHQKLSKTASAGKFKGGLADTQELTIKGHTATHLLQQALRDVLGNHVFQTGSNITTERLRFDFSHPEKLTNEQIQKVQEIVREKITQDLSVHFEMMPLKKAKEIGAIGLFDEKYGDTVKVYFIGGPSTRDTRSGQLNRDKPYSIEFCGGPHVERTGMITSFTITKQENIGHGQRRLYAVVE